MPIKFVDYQREFTFHIGSDGLPLGEVITLGQGRWLTVCGLCGCAHDVTCFRGDTYTPNCIVRVTHPAAYKNWIERFPDAAQHKAVKLVTSEQWTSLVPALSIVEKPKAKRAATKPKHARRKAA